MSIIAGIIGIVHTELGRTRRWVAIDTVSIACTCNTAAADETDDLVVTDRGPIDLDGTHTNSSSINALPDGGASCWEGESAGGGAGRRG